MKKGFLRLAQKAFVPLALIVGLAAFSPVSALAATRGGFGGHAGGHSFSAPARGFSGGRAVAPRAYYGGGYVAPRYYGPSVGFGFGAGIYPYAPYGYAAPVCNPAGFYDANGVWQPYPGCAVAPAVPYGY